MKKTAALLSLLSLFIIAASLVNAQTRPRRVGERGNTTQPSAPTAPSSAPTTASRRPPILGGSTEATTAANNTQANAQSQPTGVDDKAEIDEDDVVRVNTTLVTVPVSVTDRSGRYIPDLRKEDFRLYEDGVEQQIAYFAEVDKPFTVALVIDTSDSTRFKLEDIQDAAIAFLDQLRPDDQMMVVSFDDDIHVLTEATSNRNEIRNAIRRTRTGGSTRLYDAVDLVIKQKLSRIRGRKAIVLFTDGVDTTSRHATYQSTVSEVEELDALIYSVQYDTYQDMNGRVGSSWPGGGTSLPSIILQWPFPRFPGSGGGGRRGGGGSRGNAPGSSREDYERATQYLRELSDKTAGRSYRADDLNYIAQAFSQIAEELRRQYSIGYYPKHAITAGDRHQIRVKTTRPNLAVRSRDSYISSPNPATAQANQNQSTRTAPVLQKKQLSGMLVSDRLQQ